VAIQEVGGVNVQDRVFRKKKQGDESPVKTTTDPQLDDGESDTKLMSDPTIHGFFDFRSKKFLQRYSVNVVKSSVSENTSGSVPPPSNF
jgi:hypothetical protein